MSDLHDRLERLARRGTLRGADTVLAEAYRRADGSGVIAGVDAPAPSDGTRGVVSPINLEPASSPRKQRRFGALVTAGGVAASLFVGVLAVGSITGGGGGANSPEGALRQLADAVAREDALAAADVLAPEEVRSLRGTLDAAAKRAQELALAQSASAPFSGLDLSVDGLDLTTESLGAGYAKVTVAGGTISARTDKARFSPLMQRVLGESDDEQGRLDLATLGEADDLPTFVMTVQRDGNWYVSAAYTTLEYIRVANDLPAAELGSGQQAIATLGADTPDAAVSEALHALADADWQKLISLAPPDEIPFYDYRAALVQLAEDTTKNFTIDELDTTSTVNGDTAEVVLKASGTTPPNPGGDTYTWSVDGSCVRFPGYTISAYSESGGEVIESATPCGLGVFSIVPMVAEAPGNGPSTGITVVRKSGRWFVSPVGTVLDLVDRTIGSLTRRTLYTLLGVPDLLPPDGVLTLGQPFELSHSEPGARVYTFEGHRGQRLLGLAVLKPPTDEFGYSVTARIFAPDGTELDDSYDLFEGEAVQLPTDGTYKFAIHSFYYNSDATVTIWNEADAPEEAKIQRYPTGIDVCGNDLIGGAPCTDEGSSDGSTTSDTTTASVPGG